MTKLFQNIESFEALKIDSPVRSNSNSLTAQIRFEAIQLGELEQPFCVVGESIRNSSGHAFRVSIGRQASTWIETLEEEIKQRMVTLSSDWFGKPFSIETIDRMHCSSLVNGEIILRCTKDAASFKRVSDDKLTQIELKEIKEGHAVVLIIHLEGLFIGPKHFTPSFTVSNILSCGKARSIVEEAHPFSTIGHREEEIIDPFSFYATGETDSNGSFDTHIFHNNMQ